MMLEGDPSLLAGEEASESERDQRVGVGPPEWGVKGEGLVSLKVVMEICGGAFCNPGTACSAVASAFGFVNSVSMGNVDSKEAYQQY